MAIVKYIKDSILNAPQKYIAHGVNCRNRMGSGVAKVILDRYPEVKSEYHQFIDKKLPILINGQEDLLGIMQFVETDNHTVINMFTQENFGYDGQKYVDYDAIHCCFSNLLSADVKEIAIPKIGCGLAGGDWDEVAEIINQATKDEVDVYVYYIGE